MQNHVVKFQIALPDQVFDHLLILAKQNHRLYRQQAEFRLIETIEQDFRAWESALEPSAREVDHATTS